MPAITSRLSKLEKAASESGAFALAAAAAVAKNDPDNLDHQLDVIGALHEVGKLRNSMEPYWREWRKNERPWVDRALARLVAGDRDYWALASLLGCSSAVCVEAAASLGLGLQCIRFYERLDLPPVHVAVLARPSGDRIWAPVLEIGCDSESQEVVDVARFRAVFWDRLERIDHGPVGKGSGSNFMRAVLPHGSWRMVTADFGLEADGLLRPTP